MPSRRAAAAYAVAIVALAGVYFVGGKLGLKLAFVNSSATAVWPPTGLAIAALMLWGRRLWPGVLIGAFLVNLTITGATLTTVGIAIGNTLEAVAAAWLVRRFASGRRAFERAVDTVKFAALAGIASPALCATVGVGSLVLGGRATWSEFEPIWRTWWLGDMSAACVLTPMIVLWWQGDEPAWSRSRRHVIEIVLLFGLTVATAIVVAGGHWPLPDQRYPAQFLCAPLLVWAALRFGPRETMGCVLVLTAWLVNGTLAGVGPFARTDSNEALLLLQSFTCVTALWSLVLAVVVKERTEADVALQRTAHELERSNSDLERFAHAASHDLREPLRTVASFTQLLAKRYEGRLDREADEYIRYAVDGAMRMERLVNDMLAYSRAGSAGLRRIELPAERALDEAVAGLQAGIVAAKALVTHDPLPTVEADSGQMVQLFQNLVGNAVKFRRDEPPRVHVSAFRDGGAWVFSVRDNGIGIEPVYADRVFKMFQRLGPREKFEGSGIGLAFCKRIVERHGGRIWFESQPGAGSTFFFSLPG